MNYSVDFLVYMEKLTSVITLITQSYRGPQVGTVPILFGNNYFKSRAIFPGWCLTLKEGIHTASTAAAVTVIFFFCISKAQEREHITYVSSVTCCSKYEAKGAE